MSSLCRTVRAVVLVQHNPVVLKPAERFLQRRYDPLNSTRPPCATRDARASGRHARSRVKSGSRAQVAAKMQNNYASPTCVAHEAQHHDAHRRRAHCSADVGLRERVRVSPPHRHHMFGEAELLGRRLRCGSVVEGTGERRASAARDVMYDDSEAV